MFGPSIPKELLEKRKKRKLEQQQNKVLSEDESDLEDFIGPVLIHKPQREATVPTTTSKPSLLELHQQKTQGNETNTQYDPTKALNDEVKEELLRKLQANGGLSGRFTSSK